MRRSGYSTPGRGRCGRRAYRLEPGRTAQRLLVETRRPAGSGVALAFPGRGWGRTPTTAAPTGASRLMDCPAETTAIEALPLGYSSPVRRGGYPIVPDGLLLAEGEVIEGFVIRMDEVEVTFVSGLLVDHEGTPVPNALINPLGRNCLGTRSDEEGGFTFPCDVSEGLVDIGIRTEDPMRFYLKEQVAIGATDVVIRLDAPVTVTGTVLSGRGGSPVTAFEYQLSTVPETPDFVPSPIVGTVYSSGGTFAIEDVPPRPFSLSIWAPGYARTTQDCSSCSAWADDRPDGCAGRRGRADRRSRGQSGKPCRGCPRDRSFRRRPVPGWCHHRCSRGFPHREPIERRVGHRGVPVEGLRTGGSGSRCQ